MAKNLTPEEIVDKQIKRATETTEDLKRGVERVTEHPGRKAAAQQTKMRANTLKAIDSGYWAARVQSGTVDDWKKATTGAIDERYAGGMERSREKSLRVQRELDAFRKQLKAQVDRMPSTTEEQRNAKMNAWANGMRKFKSSVRRG